MIIARSSCAGNGKRPGLANDPHDILPDLSPEEYEILKASIADNNGVEVPISVDQDREIIDGKARRRACDELGIECPSIIRHVESETERLQLRLRLNCNRRHLNREQKRAMITAYLKTDPQIGPRELGEILGVSKNTVDSVRQELERSGLIDHFEVLRFAAYLNCAASVDLNCPTAWKEEDGFLLPSSGFRM